MIDNISDLALGNWDGSEKKSIEDTAVKIIFERLDEFYRITGIDRNKEYLRKLSGE